MSKKKRTGNVHDKFFKEQMDALQNAEEIISNALPPEIVEKLDFSSLKNLNASFTDGRRGNYQADVLYECNYGKGDSVTISLLFEHKSYPDQYPHLQLLRYMCGIWEKACRNKQALRPILPIIFYHGQPEWPYRRFQEYFEKGKISAELLPFFPAFEFLMFDLQKMGDHWIKSTVKNPFLKMALLSMRNIGSPALLKKLGDIFGETDEIPQEKLEAEIDKIERIYVYLVEGSKESEDKIVEAMNKVVKAKTVDRERGFFWKLEQKLRAEGKEEGILEGKAKGILEGKAEGKAEGRAEGKAEVALKLLEAGIDPMVISEATGLSLKEIGNLSKKAEK